MDNKKIIIGASILISVSIILGALVVLGIVAFPWNVGHEVTIGSPKEERRMTNQDAFLMARERARTWRQDAVLAYSATMVQQTTNTGRSDSWRLIFTSSQAKGKGFEIIIENRVVVRSEEIIFFGKGTTMPDNLISSEEAISSIRTLKGYEQEQVISVELVYDDKANMWFWGIKTARGIVSVKATRQ